MLVWFSVFIDCCFCVCIEYLVLIVGDFIGIWVAWVGLRMVGVGLALLGLGILGAVCLSLFGV